MSKKLRNGRCQRPPNIDESPSYEFLPTGLETNTKSKAEKFATLNSRERDAKLKSVDRGFSNSDRIVPNNPIQGCNEVFAPINNRQKMKTSSSRMFSTKQKVPKANGEDKKKVRENESYERNSPTELNSKRFNFNCQFPPPNGPIGNEGFSDALKQGTFDGYVIDDYEDIDRANQPPKEMTGLSPMARVPWYATNGQMFDSIGAPIEEQTPGIEGPQEDYIDMEGAQYQRSGQLRLKLYDEVPDEAPLPPIRKTISYATVHSHALPILRIEYHNKIPKAPMRVDSKRTVQKISNAVEKLKKSKSYDLVLDVNPLRNQLKKGGSGYLPVTKEAINNRPNDLSGKELNEVLSRRKQTIKTLNTKEEEPEQTTNSNDNNQQVFYHICDVLTSDRNKKTVASPTEAKSPIEEATEKVLNNSNPKPGSRKPTPPLAKVTPETAPRGKLQKSISHSSTPTPASNHDQNMPQKLINNMIAREKRANSVIKKEPPPVPTKRRSFCKDASNNNTNMEDKSVMEDKKGINNLVQDLENKFGLHQKRMLDSFSSKSYFPKQLNDYQDPPMNLKHVESTNYHNKVY